MKTYKDYSPAELAELQSIYINKPTLTAEEAGILYGIHPNIVRKYLREGKMVGVHIFGSRTWRVDVAKTNELLAKYK